MKARLFPVLFAVASGLIPTTLLAAEPVSTKDQAILKKLEKPIVLNLKDAPLRDILKFIRVATQGPNESGVPIYVDPEALGKAGVNVDTLVTIVSRKDEPLKESLERALASLRLRYKVEDGLLKIVAGESRPRRGFGDLIDRSAQTSAIVAQLARAVDLKLEGVPLANAVKAVNAATEGGKWPAGIPIYVDPVALQEVEKSMDSPVTLVTHGQPLRDALRAALKPIGLTFVVKDGLLTITSDTGEMKAPPRIKDRQPKK